MNKKYLLLLTAFVSFQAAVAQRLPINVNKATGTAIVTIPVVNIVNGGVSVPVSVVYGSNGNRLRDGEGTAGLGWNLSAGGQVSRTVRGLPDDVKLGLSGVTKTGWLYNTNLAAISNFSIANNSNPINCTNAQTDLNYISSNWGGYNIDTEPDVFQVSAPGLSCQFVFDNNHTIRTIPYQDLKITYTSDSGSGNITSFTVTNSSGTVYTFAITNTSTKQTTTQSNPGAFSWPEANVIYSKTPYYEYKYGIQYYDSWLLTSVTDATGNNVSLTYTDKGTAFRRTQVEYYVGGGARQPLYVINETSDTQCLSTITGSDGVATFSYGVYNNNVSQGTLINNINFKGVNYQFNYANVIFNKNQTSFRNNCLRSVTTDQCNSPFLYFFDYDGESGSLGTSQYTNRDSAYQYTDVWGYYTGIKSTSSSAVNPTNVTAGALSHIKYYDNGSTTLQYESNDFYNPTVGSVVYGGGVRIKTITDYDGINTANNIIRNYSYLNSSGTSSGIPISLPQNTFLRPVATSPTIANSTVAADNDMSENDQTVMYTNVKETQAGKGSTLCEYTIPAGAFDTSTPLGDWTPTAVHAGVSGCSPSIGLLTNTTLTYPFAPNTNYDFERGLLNKETSYDDSGNKVAQSTYTYQRSFSPIVVNAFRFDDADYAREYSAYTLLTTSSELVTEVDKIVYDPSFTTGQLNSVKYTYGSANHKQVTEEDVTNSDNSINRVNITYSKDYSGSTASTYSTALVNQNINVPLETYTSVEQPGSGSFKVTGGQVVKFASYPAVSPRPNNWLPSAVYKLVSVNGLTDFIPTATTNAATPDARYVLTNTITDYDPYGMLKSSAGIDRHPQTQIHDPVTHSPLAVFNNSAPAGIGYGMNGSTDGFTRAGSGGTSTTGRLALPLTAFSFPSNCTISRTVTMSPMVTYYILSAWINSSATGSFVISAVPTSGTSQNVTLTYQGGSVWKYYQVKIPVSTFTSSSFTVSFTAGNNITIDNELLLYPGTSTVTTAGYDANNNNIATTNTNGLSAYNTRDALGRVTLTYDQDRQITSRKTYLYASSTIIPEPLFYINVPVGQVDIYPGTYSFLLYNSFANCLLSGATYSWNYGDGSSPTSSNTHTFASTGTYNVTLTVTIPGVGSNSYTGPIVVVNPPPPVLSVWEAGDIVDHILFYQNGLLMATLYGADIYNRQVTIPPGTYDITVFTKSGLTTGSLLIEPDSQPWLCHNMTTHPEYNFTVTANQSLVISHDSASCE